MKLSASLRSMREGQRSGASGRRRHKKSRGADRLVRFQPRLETLEDRTLLSSNLPTPVATNFLDVTASSGLGPILGGVGQGSPQVSNHNSPSVAVDPLNPQWLVAVWQWHNIPPVNPPFRTDSLQMAMSTDGGKDWIAVDPFSGEITSPYAFFSPQELDPNTNPPHEYTQATNATVAFDRLHHLYLLWEAHNAGSATGVLLLDKWDFTQLVADPNAGPLFGAGPTIIYSWSPTNLIAANNPALAVDSSNPHFVDPQNPNAVQNDPFANNVYVSWNTQAEGVMLVSSSDGGVTFGPPLPLDGAGTQSSIAVSQGTASNRPGPVVAGGQVTAVWTDANPPPPQPVGPPPWAVVSAHMAGDSVAFNNPFPSGTGHLLGGPVVPVSGGFYLNAGPSPPGSTVNVPAVTDFPVNVSFPAGFGSTITHLTVTMNVQERSLDQLKMELISPTGQDYILFTNHTNADGSQNLGFGITGSNLGLLGQNLVPYNTTFDEQAINQINIPPSVAPFIGRYRPEISALPSPFFGGWISTASATGTWILRVTTFRNEAGTPPPVQQVKNFELQFTSDFLPSYGVLRGGSTGITVQPNFSGPYALRPAISPDWGIGPNVVIASDNTLGGYSPYQGRLYVAYVDQNHTPGSPTDNTDILLQTSSDGGSTWSAAQVVNDDNPLADGFSGGNRPQFEPSIAVDQWTGSLVISYLDGRFDPSRARFATMVAVSNDGGQTFAKQVFANDNFYKGTIDGITLQNVAAQPALDNVSTTNNRKDTIWSIGDRQGLAVADGQVHPVWAGDSWIWNQPQMLGNPTLPDYTEILSNTIVYASGPRVIDSTVGPVQALTALDPSNLFNNQDPTGSPVAFTPHVDGFAVRFDRPVDPASFTTSQVQAFYKGTSPSSTYVPVPIGQIKAVDLGLFGATTFLVYFQTPQTATGTYSYAVGPLINDRIRPPVGNAPGNYMDQNANSIAGQPATPATGGDVYSVPKPANNGPVFLAPFAQDAPPIILPGPHVVVTNVPGNSPFNPPADNLVVNKPVSGIDVFFDRDMNPATFTAAQVVRMVGPAGPITGPFTITPNPYGTDPNPNSPRTYRISFPTQTISGTYTVTLSSSITSAAGEPLDTNQNAGLDVQLDNPSGGVQAVSYVNTSPTPIAFGTTTSAIVVPDNYVIQGDPNGLAVALNINFPDDRNLSATLTAPDGTVIPLFTNIGGTLPPFNNFTNTVLIDSATTPLGQPNPIQLGRPPFTGSFTPQVEFSLLQGKSVHGTWLLTITNNQQANSGTLVNWSLIFAKPVPATGMGEPVADLAPVSFRIFTMDPSIAQSHNTWTAVGPASINNNHNSGRISGLAVDPSDPSGNTVYIGAASGGIWKTTNFLTENALGPTWMPLTDFGPTNSINIGGIAVFGRNGDPNQSMVFVVTGEGDTGSPGVGFVRSTDGGNSWALLDSTDNTLPMSQRDHKFVGNNGFKILVDPVLAPSGQVIVYGAMSGPHGGIWRSLDGGTHWQLVKQGQATDLVFSPTSQDTTTGNLRLLYAAFRGDTAGAGDAAGGVYLSPDSGSTWNLMAGGVGDPLIHDINTNTPIPVTAPASTPQKPANGQPPGRIVLAVPAPTGNRAEDLLYQGWVYAYVSTSTGTTSGLYLTKDFGQNWTAVRLPITPPPGAPNATVPNLVPTNDDKRGDVDILGHQGNYDITITLDPTNPNIVYLGGTSNIAGQTAPLLSSLIRVDVSGVFSDPHTVVAFNDQRNDGGQLSINTTGPVSVIPNPANKFYGFTSQITNNQYYVTNLIDDPFQPFLANATVYTFNVSKFNNEGIGGKWVPFGQSVEATTDLHRVWAMIDPITKHARLIFGDDQGLFSAVDQGDGTLVQPYHSDALSGNTPYQGPTRNGNLQITQFYAGAAQPSQLAAQAAAAMFYGGAQDDGSPASDPNVLANGNIRWNGPVGDAMFTATDQTGSGTAYQYVVPADSSNTNFFQYVPPGSPGTGIGRTFGLVQQTPTDPQWPVGPVVTPGVASIMPIPTFAINPVDGAEAVIGSFSTGTTVQSKGGNIFRTNNQGLRWFQIASRTQLDQTTPRALAYGAPDPADPTGQLDNFIYAGTTAGHIFVTFDGGGTWTNLNAAGLDGSPVMAFSTNPHRGSHEVYAVTAKGVYWMADSKATGAKWTNITNNLFSVQHNPYGNASLAEAELQNLGLTSIVADWRYALPDNVNNPLGPAHPVLYVGGSGGVFRSTNKGTIWTLFPNVANDGAPVDGGYLPVVGVTHLDLELGNVNPTTGLGDPNTNPDLLVATTYGRGMFAIRVYDPKPGQAAFSNSQYLAAVTVPAIGSQPAQQVVYNIPGDNSLWRHDSTGWAQIGGAGTIQSVHPVVEASGTIDVFAVGTTHSLFLYRGGQWLQIGGAGTIQSATAGTDTAGVGVVYVVTPTNGLAEFDLRTGWMTLGASGTILSASATKNGTVFAVVADGSVFKFSSQAGWVRLSGSNFATSLSATTDASGIAQVYAISPAHGLYQFISGTNWLQIGGNNTIEAISAGTDSKGQSNVFAVTLTGALAEFDIPLGGWVSLTSAGSIRGVSATDADRVFADFADQSIFEHDPKQGWIRLSSPGFGH